MIENINVDWTIAEDMFDYYSNHEAPIITNSEDLSSFNERTYTFIPYNYPKRCGIIDAVFGLKRYENSTASNTINVYVNNYLIDSFTISNSAATEREFYAYRVYFGYDGPTIEKIIYGNSTNSSLYNVNNSKKISLMSLTQNIGKDGVISCKIKTSDGSVFGAGIYGYATGW